MKVAIIGRTEILYDTVLALKKAGHDISIIITSKEAPEYTKKSLDFQNLAKKLDITFIKTAHIEECYSKIFDLKSDIAVSINYSGIIPKKITDLFPLGILNAHGGDLPRYRGNACQAWALINGEDRIGLCIHRMVGGELDNGDIIAREYMSCNIDTKVGQVWDWMSKETPRLYLEAVNKLSSDSSYILEKQSTNPKDALRCYPRMPVDGRIDWTKSSEDILRLINASGEPYSGAYCFWNEDKIIIHHAEMVENSEVFCAIAGQVTDINNAELTVACGEGKIKLIKYDIISEHVKIPKIKSTRVRLG